VANAASDTVSVIDTPISVVRDAVRVGHRPIALVITPDGEHVYVVNEFSNTVSVIATATNTLAGTIAVGAKPVGSPLPRMEPMPMSQTGSPRPSR
jgi:YVTN family beta-propeller protein